MKLMFLVYVLLLGIVAVTGRRADNWKPRVIYQILPDRFAPDNSTPSPTSYSDLRQYYGGTFKGIKEQLDHIQGLGVNAIWISPIPRKTNYGTEKDLQELIDACRERDIWVMLDVVATHMGIQYDGDWDNLSFLVPFDYQSYGYINDHHQGRRKWSDWSGHGNAMSLKQNASWCSHKNQSAPPSECFVNASRLDSGMSAEDRWHDGAIATRGEYGIDKGNCEARGCSWDSQELLEKSSNLNFVQQQLKYRFLCVVISLLHAYRLYGHWKY